MSGDHCGRVYVVTGAGSGIGAATADILAKEGASVVRVDLKAPATPATASGLSLAVDVSDEHAVEAAMVRVIETFGRLDGLATCAGVVDTRGFLELDAAAFRRVQDVNVLGTFLSIKSAGRRMQAGGRVVTISSIAGIRGGGMFGTAAYAASKGAVLALTKNAAREFGPKGITVNCVAPGPTDTPMTAPLQAEPRRAERLKELVPLGRSAAPTEIGEAIAWLLSPKASFVNGATLVVDGGIVMS
jgi:NAD(P)-dependent dehydrogenase (short-subunit alcohol dehydrogenase family)